MALAIAIGTATFRLWVLPPGLPQANRGSIIASMTRLLGACLLALVATSVVLLALRLAVMSGEPVMRALPVAPQVLLHTHFGPVWAIRPAALAALTIGWILVRRNSMATSPWTIILAAGAVFAISRCASGHSADAGDFTVDEAIDWLHLMAISTWVGGVFVSLWSVFPELPHWVDTQPQRAAEFARRFSISSGLALGVVLITGLYTALMRLASVASLANTEYGRTLSIKLALVAATILAGAINRNVYVKRLTAPTMIGGGYEGGGGVTAMSVGAVQSTTVGGWRSSTYFARNVAIEAGLMLATLIAVGSLLQEMPPKMMHLTHASAPSSQGQERSFALGRPAAASSAPRTVRVDLFDAKQCAPRSIRFGRDEIVRFDVTNRGTIAHEFVIGDAKEQREHEVMLEQMPDMPMPDEPNSLRLAPGQSKSIVWQFEGAGNFACASLG